MPQITKQALKRLYIEQGLSQREIAEKYNRTQAWVSKKMTEFGIDSEYTGFWTEEEKQLMKKHYPHNREKLKSELDRSWKAIKCQAIKQGLARDQEEYRKSEEVANKLRELAEEKSIDVDFGNKEALSYVLGVIDGDGYHDDKSTVGLEVKFGDFAEKFIEHLSELGLNPNRRKRRGKINVWGSSSDLVDWIMDFDKDSKFEWLKEEGDCWKYLEGCYDSDGDFSNPGPRICSYDAREKKFLKKVLESLGLEARIHSNNVYVPASYRDRFFENVDPVYEKRRP
ncbi:MAG: hypothetical protein ABEJ72_01225 [Candidatus Aenigmatarchaeota archaeon]